MVTFREEAASERLTVGNYHQWLSVAKVSGVTATTTLWQEGRLDERCEDCFHWWFWVESSICFVCRRGWS